MAGARETCLRTNHVWNAVRVAGEWWHVDMMWAVGALGRDAGGEWMFKRHWNPEYVLTRGEQFLTTHMPADPAWQLTDRPYPMNAFIKGWQMVNGEIIIITWIVLRFSGACRGMNGRCFLPGGRTVLTRGNKGGNGGDVL